MTALVSPLFITMIPMIVKSFFSLYNCLFAFFGHNYNIGESTSASATSKERMTTNIIFAGATPLMPHPLINMPLSSVFVYVLYTRPIAQHYRQRKKSMKSISSCHYGNTGNSLVMALSKRIAR